MTLQPEPWLMLVALFLYFFDAVLLLERDQAMVALAPAGWRPRFGMREWTIAGKEPLLPNPLTAHRPAYLVSWHLFTPEDGAAALRPLDSNLPFGALGNCVMVSTLCLFVLLPLSLFTRAGSVLTIFTALLVTLNNMVALAVVFRRRSQLGIDLRHFATLATECLLCPPFSLNLVRRICALQAVDEDLESIAARLFGPGPTADMQAACVARVDDALLGLAEAAPEENALRETRARLQPQEHVDEY